MRESKVGLLAANYESAKTHARELKLAPGSWIYLSKPEQLQGVLNMKVIYLPLCSYHTNHTQLHEMIEVYGVLNRIEPMTLSDFKKQGSVNG